MESQGGGTLFVYIILKDGTWDPKRTGERSERQVKFRRGCCKMEDEKT